MCSGTNASNKKTSTDTSKCKRVCAAIVAQLPEWSLLTIGDLGSNPAITTFYTDHWFIGNCLKQFWLKRIISFCECQWMVFPIKDLSSSPLHKFESLSKVKV